MIHCDTAPIGVAKLEVPYRDAAVSSTAVHHFEMARGTWTMAKETLLRAGSLRSRSVRMRHLLILAAAAFLAVGCARNQDETGAAPDQGDTTTVTATDTTDQPTDSTMGQAPAETDTSFVQQDTTAADATMSTDSVGAQGEVPTGDTTSHHRRHHVDHRRVDGQHLCRYADRLSRYVRHDFGQHGCAVSSSRQVQRDPG